MVAKRYTAFVVALAIAVTLLPLPTVAAPQREHRPLRLSVVSTPATAPTAIPSAATSATAETTTTPPVSEPATQAPTVNPWKVKDKSVAVYKAPKARSVIAIDAGSGHVLYQRNAKKAYSVASIAKLMTVLMMREKLARGEGSWNTKIRINSTGLVKMSASYDCGGWHLKKGASYTLRDLYRGALVESSNAAAITLGIWTSGSNTKFIAAMNKRAKKLGLKSAKFVSASGLDNKDLKRFGFKVKGTTGKATNKISAADVAKLAQTLLVEFPNTTDTTKLTKVKVKGKTLRTTNALLKGKAYYVKSLRVDGLKTGTTQSAGACLVATAQPKGRCRIITVVLHDRTRFPDSNKLLRSCYERFVLE